MADVSIIGFSGDSGPGDTIDLSVPLPGSHTGRRIIELEGIPDTAWSSEAINAGTDYASELGIENDDDEYCVANPELFAGTWFDKLSSQSSIKNLNPSVTNMSASDITSAIDSVYSSVIQNAIAFKNEKGHLKGWPTTTDIPIPVPTDANVSVVSAKNKVSQTAATDSFRVTQATASSAFSAMGSLISTFQRSMASISQGIVYVPTSTWGGGTTMSPIDITEQSQPRLFLIHVMGISSFLGNYGLGRTIKTFTLLPGEETTISMRTWRATDETRTESSSIIDSYDVSSADRFAETVLDETTDTATQAETKNWKVEGEASASWGSGKASVSASKSGESASSTEEFARSMEEAVSEHTAEASSHRENTVTSSSESSQSTSTETVIERTIKNINLKRVLNFVFRELNQTYTTKIHLKDIRIAFSNGRSGSWREVPLSGLAGLLEDLISDAAQRDAIAQGILSQVAVIFDSDDDPVNVLERVTMGPCGASYESVADAMPGDNCLYACPPSDYSWFYRFKRGNLSQKDSVHPVPGVLLRETDIVLRTDSVVVEALLGVNDALDKYSDDLQVETIREKLLANNREALAQRLVADGDTTKAELFTKVFGQTEATEE